MKHAAWTVEAIDPEARVVTFGLSWEALAPRVMLPEQQWAGFMDFLRGRVDEAGWPTRDAAGR